MAKFNVYTDFTVGVEIHVDGDGSDIDDYEAYKIAKQIIQEEIEQDFNNVIGKAPVRAWLVGGEDFEVERCQE